MAKFVRLCCAAAFIGNAVVFHYRYDLGDRLKQEGGMGTDVVIVAAGRTAIGSFSGALGELPASALGAKVIAGLLERSGLKPERISEVIMGQILTAGVGQNPARQAAIEAGLPYSVPCMTINKVCGSGLKSVHLATQALRCGDAEVIIAGGQENMTLAPHVLPKSRVGTKMGDWVMKDSMIVDGLWDAFNQYHMGNTAENVAREYGITRDELAFQNVHFCHDRFARNQIQKLF